MHDIFQRQYVSFLKTHHYAIPQLLSNENANLLHRIKAKFKKLHQPKRAPTATLIVKPRQKAPNKKQLYRSKTAKKIVTGCVDRCELMNFLSPKMSLKDPLDNGHYFNSNSDRSISRNLNADINKEDTSIAKKDSASMSKSIKELDNSNQQESAKNLYASCSPRCHISPALKHDIKQASSHLSRHLYLHTSYPRSLRTEVSHNGKNALVENIRIEGIKKISPTQIRKQHTKCHSNVNTKIHPKAEGIVQPAILITNEKNKAVQSLPVKTVTQDPCISSKELHGLLMQRKKISRLKCEKKAVDLESAGIRAISKIDIRRKCAKLIS